MTYKTTRPFSRPQIWCICLKLVLLAGLLCIIRFFTDNNKIVTQIQKLNSIVQFIQALIFKCAGAGAMPTDIKLG